MAFAIQHRISTLHTYRCRERANTAMDGGGAPYTPLSHSSFSSLLFALLLSSYTQLPDVGTSRLPPQSEHLITPKVNNPLHALLSSLSFLLSSLSSLLSFLLSSPSHASSPWLFHTFLLAGLAVSFPTLVTGRGVQSLEEHSQVGAGSHGAWSGRFSFS